MGKREPVSGQLLEYLVKERCIPEEVVRRNHVSQMKARFPDHGEEEAIVFAYHADDRVVAEKLRTIAKHFISTPGGEACLYGVDDLVGADVIVLTEGEMDKLSVEAAGIQAVASLQSGCGGGCSLAFGAAESLGHARRIVLATDGDEGGQMAALQMAKQLGYFKCFAVKWPEGCKDANDVLRTHGPVELKRLIDNAIPITPFGVQLFNDEVFQTVQRRISGDIPYEFIRGVPTGWARLDRCYRPVKGEMTSVTGIPGSGKSEWLLSLVMNLAEDRGWRTLLYTFEATDRNLSVQLMEKKLRKPYSEISQEEADTCQTWLWEHFCIGTSEEYESPTIDAVLEMATAEADSAEGLDGLIIDPYNYLTRSQEVETDFISHMLSKIKQFAHEKKVHVWVVAHPTKSSGWAGNQRSNGKDAPEDVVPSLYDISGSAHWYNKTDMGIVVHRVKMMNEKGEQVPTKNVEVHIQKVRNKEAIILVLWATGLLMRTSTDVGQVF
ncbi:unnamed protein product [Polarella glacialis]|uniref:SF4 helicase domain-containing protein n=1 Tax=Polarella glacialis TaxID=89957 RepID=A0A813JPW5_POLGL|nr:unnamed protein product [Polarella glacialis]